MHDLVAPATQALSEHHQFLLAICDKIVSLATLLYLGASHPPSFKKQGASAP